MSRFTAPISVHASAFDNVPSGTLTLPEIVGRIRDGLYKESVAAHRKGAFDKRLLAAFTFSGHFRKRNRNGLIAHSGLLQIDIDAKDNPKTDMVRLRKELEDNDPCVVAVFKSAGGAGLKVIVAISTDPKLHRASALAAEGYFWMLYEVKIDPSCKDIPRLCFASDDDAAWIAPPDKEIREIPIAGIPAVGAGTMHEPPVSFDTDEQEFAAVQRVEEVLSFIPPRPRYPEWLKVLSGVFAEIPFAQAVLVLNMWSPEEDENQYERKFPERLKEVGFGTVIRMAMDYGYDNSAAANKARAVNKLPDLEAGDTSAPADEPSSSAAGRGPAAQAKEPEPKSRITRLPSSIVAVRKMPHFVDGVLMPCGFSLWYGQTNKGKSFLVQDLAAAIASGRNWRNGEVEIVGHGPVVFCALEGGFGAENRILALKAKGLLKDGDPFGLITVPVRLLEKGIKRGAAIICDGIKEMQDDFGAAVKWVVIDTWARATAGGGEENSNSDAMLGVAQCDEVRAAAAHAALAAVHHAGKDESKGARGATALVDACDTEIEIYRPDGSDISTAIVRKQRDMEFREPMPFRLEQIQVGADYRGKPVTSCTVIHLRPDEGTVRGAKGGRPSKVPSFQFLDLLSKEGASESVTAWRDMAEKDLGVSRRTFYRKLEDLKKGGHYEEMEGGKVVLIKDIFGNEVNNGGAVP